MRSRAGATLPALRRSLRRKAPARHLSGSEAGAFRSPTTPQERASEKNFFHQKAAAFPESALPDPLRRMGGRISVTGVSAPAHLRARPLAGACAASLPALPRFRVAPRIRLARVRDPRSLLRPRHTRLRVIPARLAHTRPARSHTDASRSAPRGRLFSPPVRPSSHRSRTPWPGIGPQHARPVRLPFSSFPVVVSCSLRSERGTECGSTAGSRGKLQVRRVMLRASAFRKSATGRRQIFLRVGPGKDLPRLQKKALQKRTTTLRFPRQDVSFPRGAYPSSSCGGRAECSCTPAGCRS